MKTISLLLVSFLLILFAFPGCKSDEPIGYETIDKIDEEPSDIDEEDISQSENEIQGNDEESENPGNNEETENGGNDEENLTDEDEEIGKDEEPTVVEYYLQENLIIDDPVNNRRWEYSCVLPSTFYTDPEKEFSLLILLHGYSLYPATWIEKLALMESLESVKDNFPETVIIMPNGAKTYYLDGIQDDIKYETFFIDYFLPYIEQEYRISKDKKDRTIGGFSMGGYGSAYYATKYPDKFGLCYAISAPLDGKGNIAQVPEIFTTEVFSDVSILPYYVFDIGRKDGFLSINKTINMLLEVYDVPHELVITTGGHYVAFWKRALKRLLQYIPEYRETK